MGQHKKAPRRSMPMRELALLMPLDLVERIEQQHTRLRKEDKRVSASLNDFLLGMLGAGVDALEQQERDGMLVKPVGAMTKQQMDEVSARLQAAKAGQL